MNYLVSFIKIWWFLDVFSIYEFFKLAPPRQFYYPCHMQFIPIYEFKHSSFLTAYPKIEVYYKCLLYTLCLESEGPN